MKPVRLGVGEGEGEGRGVRGVEGWLFHLLEVSGVFTFEDDGEMDFVVQVWLDSWCCHGPTGSGEQLCVALRS